MRENEQSFQRRAAGASPDMDSSDPDDGGPGDTLSPSEATDSDEIGNDDGDQVVDPPEHRQGADKYRAASEGEPLDDKLAAEEPDTPAETP